MPTFEWIGKDKVINHHQEVPFRVLERQYSYDEKGQHKENNDSENMIIHGDNLEALKALLPKYENRVKCIYIDPPYNTGNEGWVYNDNVNDPKIRKWLGEVVGKEGDDLTRHDKWLCMMYPRLKMLHKLLSDDGVIFISIDDNELANLKLVCNEIFGINCFISNISWQRTYSTRNDSKGIVNEVEHILVYSKCPEWSPNKLARTAGMNSIYKSPDGDPKPWTSSSLSAPGAATHQGMVYGIQHPFTGEIVYPTNGRCWSLGQQQMLENLCQWCPYELKDLNDTKERADICGLSENEVRKDVKGIVLVKTLEQSREMAKSIFDKGRWPYFYFTDGGKGGIRRKTYLENMGGRVPTNLWTYSEVGHTDEAKKEQNVLFNGKGRFDTPKPVRLIDFILKIAGSTEALILDSFAGSGTTAHAVLNMNKADGGNRKFILIEMMDYADTITAERVKRVISGYKTEEDIEELVYDKELSISNLANGREMMEEAKLAAAEAKAIYDKVSRPQIKDGRLQVIGTRKSSGNITGTGGSFSYYELGEPLLIDGQLNESVGIKKIREYIWYMETRQHDFPIHVENDYYLGTCNHIAYYFHYEPNKVCLLDYAFLSTVKEKADGYIIYADRCSLSDTELLKLGITFKKIPRDITKL